MKRSYLVNTLMFLILMVYTNLVKSQGFFMALIIRQDIIWYIVVLPAFILIGIFGIVYQLLKIDFKDTRKLSYQLISILTTLYLFFFLIFFTRIYLTSSIGAFIVLSSVPVGGIIASVTLILLYKHI